MTDEQDQLNFYTERVNHIIDSINIKPAACLSEQDRKVVAERIGILINEVEEKNDLNDILNRLWMFRKDNNAARTKLRRYALMNKPKERIPKRRFKTLAKRADTYARFLKLLTKSISMDYNECLVRIFRDTEMDYTKSSLRKHEWIGYTEFQLTMERAISAIESNLNLKDCYLNIGHYGAICDVSEYGLSFSSRSETPSIDIEDTMDLFISACIPVINAIKGGIDLPSFWTGLIPSLPIYRIQIGEPIPVKMNLSAPTEQTGVVKEAQRITRADVCYYCEIRLGIAPLDGSGESGPVFECRNIVVVREAPINGKPSADKIKEYIPKLWNAENGLGSLNSDGQFRISTEKRWRRGIILDLDTRELVSEHHDLESMCPGEDDFRKISCDSDRTLYEPVNADTCKKYFGDLPDAYQDKVEYLIGHKDRVSVEKPGFLPGSTFGRYVENNLDVILKDLRKRADEYRGALELFRDREFNNIRNRYNEVISDIKNTTLGDTFSYVNRRDYLKKWRDDLNLTQAEASKLLGMSVRAYIYHENGEKPIPILLKYACEYCRLHYDYAKAISYRDGPNKNRLIMNKSSTN